MMAAPVMMSALVARGRPRRRQVAEDWTGAMLPSWTRELILWHSKSSGLWWYHSVSDIDLK
jgi:hypothetical protein